MYIYIYTHTHTMEYTHNGISAIKNNKIRPFEDTWMDPEIVILSEVCQTQKDKYYNDINYMWILKKGTNELIYKTESQM